jgi:hypothetical protein
MLDLPDVQKQKINRVVRLVCFFDQPEWGYLVFTFAWESESLAPLNCLF